MTIEEIVEIAQAIDFLYFEMGIIPSKRAENEKKILELVEKLKTEDKKKA